MDLTKIMTILRIGRGWLRNSNYLNNHSVHNTLGIIITKSASGNMLVFKPSSSLQSYMSVSLKSLRFFKTPIIYIILTSRLKTIRFHAYMG